MSYTPAIVIAAYNRPHTLSRLLRSVANAHYSSANIPLVISIDKSDSDEVLQIAEAFTWAHGEKKIIRQESNLGLKQHIMTCGNLSAEYSSIVMLEDDLLVAPYFYSYSVQALNHYSNDGSIAGISLYSYAITENGFLPFYPLADGNSQYFMQLPSSWGQAYTAAQWKRFIDWYEGNNTAINALPSYINAWSTQSWKKHFVQYMMENDKYFVFPKTAYTTNCGDPGVNTDRQGLYQVQLAQVAHSGTFADRRDSNAIYDAWFELQPKQMSVLAKQLSDYDYTVDLYGTKDLVSIKTNYLLSSKPCAKPIFTYGNLLPDVVQNISLESEGKFFSFGETKYFSQASIDTLQYYTTLEPVKDIVLNEYITQKLGNYIEEYQYQQAYPKVHIVLLSGEAKDIRTNYPKDRLQVSVLPSNEDLGSVYTDDGSNAYFILLKEGDVIQPKLISEAVGIMEKYPDINWLTFSNNESIRLQRWNKHLFEQSTKRNSKRSIDNTLTIISKKAWQQIAHLNYTNLNAVWAKLFETEQLYTCISPNVLVSTIQIERLESSIADRFWEKLYVNNVAYLRGYYKGKQGLPAVVRKATDNDSYYLADY